MNINHDVLFPMLCLLNCYPHFQINSNCIINQLLLHNRKFLNNVIISRPPYNFCFHRYYLDSTSRLFLKQINSPKSNLKFTKLNEKIQKYRLCDNIISNACSYLLL